MKWRARFVSGAFFSIFLIFFGDMATAFFNAMMEGWNQGMPRQKRGEKSVFPKKWASCR
jgi:hypothetical protein